MATDDIKKPTPKTG